MSRASTPQQRYRSQEKDPSEVLGSGALRDPSQRDPSEMLGSGGGTRDPSEVLGSGCPSARLGRGVQRDPSGSGIRPRCSAPADL